MNKKVTFFFVTWGVGLMLQALFFYWMPSGLPTPQWLLLAVLAFGSGGWTLLAMTLGFLWGLCLDAYGVGAFGVQGWVLATVGYVSGTFSKNLNSEKWGTQEALALAATAVLWGGGHVLSVFFEHTWVGRPGIGWALLQAVLNGLVAPVVFGAVVVWVRWWGLPGEVSRA